MLLFILGNMGAVGSNAANGNVSSGSMILGGPQGASGVNLRGGMGKNFSWISSFASQYGLRKSIPCQII